MKGINNNIKTMLRALFFPIWFHQFNNFKANTSAAKHPRLISDLQTKLFIVSNFPRVIHSFNRVRNTIYYSMVLF